MKSLMLLSQLISLLLMFLLIFLNLISKKTFMDREKSSPFECGFDPKNSARMPFSLQFFMIAIIFIIFDVELAILLPMVLALEMSKFQIYSYMMMFFIMILLIGLYHEWKQGALTWVK
uniref:NADH-ubiquinone oxidoreductase chain 3 n=1 Tax=Myllocerinus aurolineatus TaxID=2527849 RepID=A0A411LW20_9CUCU|nr:NADH dehydrogenase subunit 3 [Myllocerinus aurolineatus]QBF03597.1 NADH dehydrogenase subunit 3 [Myllocerinus aurolineatus]